MTKKTKRTKVSECCGVPIVQATAPFTSLLCPECVNMTRAVTAEAFAAAKAYREKAAPR